MKQYVSIAGIALATLMGAVPALGHAAEVGANVTAKITQLKFELIDLKPDDGLAPWIQLEEERYGGFVFSRMPVQGDTRGGAGELTLSLAGSSATSASDASSTRADSAVTTYGRSIFASSSSNRSFTLSPWTGLYVTAIGAINGGSGAGAELSGSVILSLTLGSDYDYDEGTVFGGQTSGNWWLDAWGSTGATSLSGIFGTTATADTSLAPVPEPSTYGMLLAGIGIIGAVARRKAQRQRG